MSDFPIRLQFSQDERNKLLAGFRHERMPRKGPREFAIAEEVWRSVCSRVSSQLTFDGVVMVLCSNDVLALVLAVDLNPLGRKHIGTAWDKVCVLYNGIVDGEVI